MAERVSSGKRHFKYKHPLFQKRETEQGIWWEQSHYYVWFACLLRHEGYRRYCETEKGTKYKKLFEGFGNVFEYADNFKGWWKENSRGLYLFAEPKETRAAIVTPSKDMLIDSDEVIYLQLPAHQTEAYLIKKTRELIKHEQKKRGIDAAKTTGQCRFPFCQSPQSSTSYLNYLKVWDLRQQGIKNDAIHDTVYGEVPFNAYGKQWLIKKHKKYGGYLEGEEADGKFEANDLRYLLNEHKNDIRRQIQKYKSAVVKRAFDSTENMNRNAGNGAFPKTSK